MNKNLHDIDHLFQQKINDFRQQPDETVWNNIENSLNKKANKTLQSKYNNAKKIAAILLLLLLCSLLYTSIKNKNSNAQQKNSSTQIQQNDIVINKDNKNKSKSYLQTENESSFSGNKNENIIQSVNESSIISNKRKSEAKLDINNKSTIVKKNTLKQTKNKTKTNTISNELLVLEKNENVKNEGLSINEDQNDIALQNLKTANNLLQHPDQNTFLAKNIYTGKINIKKIKVSKKVSFSIFATPQFAFNRIEDEKEHKRPMMNNARPGIPYDNRDKIKNEESDFKTFSTGLQMQINITKKLSFATGLVYSSQQSITNAKKVYAEKDANGEVKFKHNCSFGSTYINPKLGTSVQIGDSAIAAATSSNLQFIGIPVQIGYKMAYHKFIVQPTFGFTLNFLAKQKLHTGLIDDVTKQTKANIDGVKNSFVNANFAIQFHYALNKKIAINLAPIAQFAITSINKNNTVKSYPNNFGISTGLQFSL